MEKDEPKPRPREPAPDVAPREDVVVPASPVRCPFCHDAVDAAKLDWVVCRSCLARHHEGCWGESGQCASCGHDTALGGGDLRVATPPARVSAQRRSALLVTAMLVALLVALALAAALGSSSKKHALPPPPPPVLGPPAVVSQLEPVFTKDLIDGRFERTHLAAKSLGTPGHTWSHITLHDPQHPGLVLAEVGIDESGRSVWVEPRPRAVVSLRDLEGPELVLDRAAPLAGHFRFSFAGDKQGEGEHSQQISQKIQRALGRFPDVLSWASNTLKTTALIRLEAKDGVSLDSIAREFDGHDGFSFVGTEIVGGLESVTYHLRVVGQPADGGLAARLRGAAFGAIDLGHGVASGDSFTLDVARANPLGVAELDRVLYPARLDRQAPFRGLVRVKLPHARSENVTRLQAQAASTGGQAVGSIAYERLEGANLTLFFPQDSPSTLGKIEAAFAGEEAALELAADTLDLR